MNKFEEALRASDQEVGTVKNLLLAQTELAKELVLKRTDGVTLTEVEKRFIQAVAMFSVQMIISPKF